LPSLYQSILLYFHELKGLSNFDQTQDLILVNNKEILVEGKTCFFREWLDEGIISIQDLPDDTDHFLSYTEFKTRYACRSNFLQYYQVISAIPKNLLNKAKISDPVRKESYSAENGIVQLDEITQLDLNKAKTCDFYKLLNVKTPYLQRQHQWSGDQIFCAA